MTPVFSIVIPVFNRAGPLREAIASVLRQTEQDLEIVIVDDGSKDDPKAVAHSFGDERIRFLRQDNRGGAAARNRGIDASRGRYVAFLDSDDVMLPHHLAVSRILLESGGNVATYARIVVERGGGRNFLKPPRPIAPDEHMATYLMCDRGFVPTITLAVPREIAARIRYDESLPCAQDVDFAIRLFLAGCRFVMADNPGAVWRDLPDPGRASAGRKSARLRAWLERLRPNIPEKAYYGARGWMIAKRVVAEDRTSALIFYLGALRRGCYSVRLSAVVFLQIWLSDGLYRRLADRVVAAFHGAVWSRAERGEAAVGGASRRSGL